MGGIIDFLRRALRLRSGQRHRIRIARNVDFHLHVDADRDGQVDDERAATEPWQWGSAGKGAVILVNNDDDDGGDDPDNTDTAVNGADDVSDLAPLVIRRVGPEHVPAGWTVELSAQDRRHIRIFDRMTAAGQEVIGPDTGESYQLPDLNHREFRFGMEATRYAGTGFDGMIRINLSCTSPEGQNRREHCFVRAAPWMMPSHLDEAETVFVVNARRTNRRFRRELRTLVERAGCTLEQHRSNDIWMQDCMEIGRSNLPGHGIHAVMRAPRNRPLHTFPRTLLRPEFGYHEQGDINTDTTFDSNGNLEVSPGPVTSRAGKSYPWGRIYYGGPGRRNEPFDPDVKEFLRRQYVQEPIEVDTTWLMVAHVDEIISFVPGGPKGFSMVLSSPRLARQMLNNCLHGAPAAAEYVIQRGDTLSAIAGRHSTDWRTLYDYDGGTGRRNRNRLRSGDPDLIYPGESIVVPRSGARMLVGRSFPAYDEHNQYLGERDVEMSVADFVAQGLPAMAYDLAEIRDANDRAINALDGIRDQFKQELGLDDGDIIELPVIYMPNELSPNLTDALTAGVVNMLVINELCIVPKPFGPVVAGADVFETDIRTKLERIGLDVEFLDDWDEYHVALGEVHCGTNTVRTLTSPAWWEFEP